MPEMLIFGLRQFDGPTALYALYDYVSTGKRGARGTLIPDDAAAGALSVDPQTIAAWRTSLVDLGLCRVERKGRAWRKHVTRGHPKERFVMVPALVVRALLGGHISRLGFRAWAMLTNQRIEPGRHAGSWRSVPWLAAQLGGRDPQSVSAALAELRDAGVLRIDDFGPGHRRRLVPLHARPVTQYLPRGVREAAEVLVRRASLRRPRLARVTPPPDQGHAPPPNHGHPGSPHRPSPQVGQGTGAPPVGRDLVRGDLSEEGDTVQESLDRLARRGLGSLARWFSERLPEPDIPPGGTPTA